jgi:hypothetical protein
MESHVVLRSVLEFEEEDAQVHFDEAARRLVLIKHREFVALPLRKCLAHGASPPQQVIRCDNGGKVEAVRFSLNHRFVAVQRSSVQLEFLDLLMGGGFTHTCHGSGKARWRILGFQWTGTPVSDFFVVTSAGVEFYLVLPDRQMLKLVKALSLAVSWCMYSHETRLLLLATGAQDNTMHGLQIQPQAIVRIPKFEVQMAPPPAAPAGETAQRLRRSLQPCHVSVARLYSMIFCVHVEPDLQQVFLYQLYKDFVVRKYALQLYSSQVRVSVIDNLLLVHALDAQVVLLFDIKINSQFAITAPLPLALVAADGFSSLYSPHWSMSSPDYVVDPQAGRVGQLALSLEA